MITITASTNQEADVLSRRLRAVRHVLGRSVEVIVHRPDGAVIEDPALLLEAFALERRWRDS